MPKGEIYKVKINKAIFRSIVKACNSSIPKLAAIREIGYSEKTIRRALDAEKMTPILLDRISKSLNVDSRLLSGDLHRKAEAFSDELLKEIYLSQLTVENYPYYRKYKDDFNKQPIEITLERILFLFEISIAQFEALDFESKYSLQHDLYNAIVPVIKKYFTVDAYGLNDMPNLEKIIYELECSKEDYYLNVYANEVLRKKLLDNPPPGKKKSEIRKMDVGELIAFDMNNTILPDG